MKKILCGGFVLLCLTACGQKGALYLPEKNSQPSNDNTLILNEKPDVTSEALQENPNDY